MAFATRILVLLAVLPLGLPATLCPCRAADLASDVFAPDQEPADHDDCPCDDGCAVGTDQTAAPAAVAVDPPLPTGVIRPVSDGPPAVLVRVAPVVVRSASDPPLFLSHCALVR